MTEDEINEEIAKMNEQKEKRGFVKGLSFEHWQRFIKGDGSLDVAALLEYGYREAQIPYIETEMVKQGWIARRAGTDSVTAEPLPSPPMPDVSGDAPAATSIASEKFPVRRHRPKDD